MAVYTQLNPDQWKVITDALGFDKLRWVAQKRGTSESIYIVKLEKAGHQPVIAILKIFETPDVHQNGVDVNQAKFYPKLVEHILNYGPIRDRQGEDVKFALPTPLAFKNGKSFMTMRFPSKIAGQKSVEKVIHVVHYIQGNSLKHNDNLAQSVITGERLGAAHAAWLKAATGFSAGRKFVNPFPVDSWEGYINCLVADPNTIKKFALKLQDDNQVVNESDPDCEKQAKEQLNKLVNAVKYISANWRKKTKNLPNQVIHGDPFPDNCIVADDGTVFVVDKGSVVYGKNTDIAMGLNAAAMGPNGKLNIEVASAYLKAYDNVSPLLEAEKQALEFMGQVSAIRWCLSRALLIAFASDKTIIKKRPLGGLLQQYEFWRQAELNDERVADKLLKVSVAAEKTPVEQPIHSQINLIPEDNLLQIPGKATYYPLLHALRCKFVGERLGVFNNPKELNFSHPLSSLTKQSCYLFSGLDILEGKKEEKIKNYQVLGYIVEAIWPTYEELNSLSDEHLFLRKKNFIKNRANAGNEILDKIDNLQLAIWERFNNTPVVTPTSGNFGLAALDWLEKMRNLNVADGVPLLAPDEGRVILWLPKPTEITRSKLGEVVARANALNAAKLENGETFGIWNATTDRDPDSLIYALKEGAYYWQTNPFSAADIKNKLIDGVIARSGIDTLFSPQAKFTLEAMGCRVNSKNREIEIFKGSLGGQFGLMLPRLIIEELTAAQTNKTIVIPPSAGGTAAACIEAGRMLKEIAEHAMTQSPYFNDLKEKAEFDSLLETYFPQLAQILLTAPEAYIGQRKTRIVLARHTGNENLVEGLGLKNQPPKSDRYISGIGSNKGFKYAIHTFSNSIDEGGELFTENDIIPTPIVFTKIAQVLIFIGEIERKKETARMPEEAAAIPAGGELYQAFLENKCDEREIAQMLRRGEVTKESFIKLVGDEFYKNSYDGKELDEMMERILELLDSSASSKTPLVESKSGPATILYVTGNTGTEQTSENFRSTLH